jgi:hypothetical protein
MRRSCSLATVFAVFLLAVSVSAFANPSNDGFNNVSLTGVSGTVSGQFTFNSSNDTFSGLSLTFNGGVFDKVNVSNGSGQGFCAGGSCYFTWWASKNGDSVWEEIILNLKSGQFQDYGGISNWQNQGGFSYMSVPEGGTELSYLMLSGFAIFAGILIAGKRRRTRTAQFI